MDSTSLLNLATRLRELTGIGTGFCKRALVEAHYDLEKAKKIVKDMYIKSLRQVVHK
jgi:translation elongation factor EF-Ts